MRLVSICETESRRGAAINSVICVDQAEMVIHKLMDRGTHQAFGVVRNADDFLDRIVTELKKLQ